MDTTKWNNLFPKDEEGIIKNTENTIRECIIKYYTPLLEVLEEDLKNGELFPDPDTDKDKKDLYKKLCEIRDSWEEAVEEFVSPDTTLSRRKEISYSTEEWMLNLFLLYTTNEWKVGMISGKLTLPDYRIVIDPETGERSESKEKMYLYGDKYFVPGQGILSVVKEKTDITAPLRELRILSNLPSPSTIKISKDILSSEFRTAGDLLDIGSEEEKKTLANLQKKGKLLFGTLEGLSGGSAFFKSFSLILAKILNEQSKYYNPEGGKGDKRGDHLLSGIPRERIREVFGDSAKLERANPIKIGGEDRAFPYILLSYERVAKYASKTGKIAGGKDVEFIRQYINGGYREFETDPKTGDRKPVKSSYTPGIASKKYPISNGKGGFIFVPFVVNEGDIVDTTRKDPEVGCLLRLSPLYYQSLRGYSALRGDTIQLIGGSRQKDITMELLPYLALSKNTTNELRKRKEDILSKYRDKPTYRGRPGKLEEHFQEAVQKAIDAKILLPGRNAKGELLGYREDTKNPKDVICVFVFNPDYFSGEDPTTPEDHPGGE